MSSDSDPDGTELPPDDGTGDPILVGGERLPAEGPGSLAPILPRALARLTDLVLSLLVPVTVLVALFGETTVDAQGQDVVTYPDWVRLAPVAILAAYEIGLVAWRGQTVGMMIGGLTVIRERDGLPPTQQDAARRAAVPVICIGFGLIIPIFQIAYLAVYLSPILEPRTRKGWHDRLAGTLVVRRR
jgi:uncharacterized RDD family membrane protein YckC